METRRIDVTDITKVVENLAREVASATQEVVERIQHPGQHGSQLLSASVIELRRVTGLLESMRRKAATLQGMLDGLVRARSAVEAEAAAAPEPSGDALPKPSVDRNHELGEATISLQDINVPVIIDRASDCIIYIGPPDYFENLNMDAHEVAVVAAEEFARRMIRDDIELDVSKSTEAAIAELIQRHGVTATGEPLTETITPEQVKRALAWTEETAVQKG